MITLSNGYRSPSTGDRSFWADLTHNIIRLNGHKHDGEDSEKIAPSDIAKVVQNLEADWGAVPNQEGTYVREVTMPDGYTYESAHMRFLTNSGPDAGQEFHPTVLRTGANTFDLYSNDNTLAVKVIYG